MVSKMAFYVVFIAGSLGCLSAHGQEFDAGQPTLEPSSYQAAQTKTLDPVGRVHEVPLWEIVKLTKTVGSGSYKSAGSQHTHTFDIKFRDESDIYQQSAAIAETKKGAINAAPIRLITGSSFLAETSK